MLELGLESLSYPTSAENEHRCQVSADDTIRMVQLRVAEYAQHDPNLIKIAVEKQVPRASAHIGHSCASSPRFHVVWRAGRWWI